MSLRDVSYSCGQCGFSLNLSSSNRLISSIGPRYSKASRRGILYFLSIDESRFRMLDEVKCGPYFESPGKWGLQKMRTKLLCRKCGAVIGHVQTGPSSQIACLHMNTAEESSDGRTFCVKIRALQPEQVADFCDSVEQEADVNIEQQHAGPNQEQVHDATAKQEIFNSQLPSG